MEPLIVVRNHLRLLRINKSQYIVEYETGRKGTTYGVKLPAEYEGFYLFGRLLMELRDNGRLDYYLPDDAFDFLTCL